MIKLHEEESVWGKRLAEKTVADILPYSIVVIDKPCGPSSHEVSAYVKRMLGVPKAGHSGTLDPEVSGVLPVLLGEATKAAGHLLKDRKTYVALMKLREAQTDAQLEKVFARFRGKIYQTPPKKSAVKRALRVREIHTLKLLENDGHFVLFESDVEAGTYIRKLCYDMGEVLLCGGLMAELRRTVAAGFGEKTTHTMQDLSDAIWLWKEKGDEKPLRAMLIPVENAIQLKKVVVSDGAIQPITTGANLAIPGILALDEKIKADDAVQIVSGKGELVCLAKALLSTEDIQSREKGIAFDIERVIRRHTAYAPA
ncbi:RNA-guided pseudouridylation complex pseudouridine synthase subunit Cbf5 [Candidatus Micrarchaeota archaeon]|nr:RNA-guided pseudouridylation complex pseudouridine synthase subunit Cbf5 [Candidatus Micrarchaeota archaeon]